MVVSNEFYGAAGVGAATVPFYAYGSVNVAACVAVGTTTTGPATTSTVPPSTVPPPPGLVLAGEAVCAGGVTSVTWTVSNNTSASIAGTDLNLAFGVSGVTVPAGDSQEAVEEIAGPAAATVVNNEFYGASGSGPSTQPFYASASVAVAACTPAATTTTVPAATTTTAEATTTTAEATTTPRRRPPRRPPEATTTTAAEATTTTVATTTTEADATTTTVADATTVAESTTTTEAGATGPSTEPASTTTSSTTSSAPSTTAPASAPAATLTGNAVCDPETGRTTMTWTVRNNTESPTNIRNNTLGLTFDPNPVRASETSTAAETLDGPVADEQAIQTVTVDFGNGETSELSASVTVGACTGPPVPPEISFSFTNDASIEDAEVGDTIDYTYCGENSSDVELEVVRFVDDQFGILEVPEERTVVEPGDSLCSTDLGLPVSHVVTEADAGTTIVNNATVTLRTVGDEPETFQATDSAEVEIVGFRSPDQVEPTTTAGSPVTATAQPTTGLPPAGLAGTGANALPAQLIAAALVLAAGWLLVMIGRRRNAS